MLHALPLAPCHQRSVSEQSGVHIPRKKKVALSGSVVRYKDTPLILISNSSGRGVRPWSRCGPARADGGVDLANVHGAIDLSNASKVPFVYSAVAKGHETTPVRSTRLIIKHAVATRRCALTVTAGIKCLDA